MLTTEAQNFTNMNHLIESVPGGRIGKACALLLALLIFFVSLDLLSEGFQLMGEGVAEALIATTANPITGIFVGILATTLVQSSSTSTSLTVALVATGTLSTAAAIPIILGANIGTSVTNTIVSLAHVRDPDEFKRAFTGALVLDYFNIIAIAIFFVVELTTSALSWTATQLTTITVGMGVPELFNPLDIVVEPIADFIVGLTAETGWIVLILAVAFLYFALRALVKLLQSILDADLEEKIRKHLFGSPWKAILFGFVITTAVQSSSITTSVIIPLIALSVIVAIQALPYFIGANIGTSTTALIAALALSSDGSAEGIAALNVAFVHMSFEGFAIVTLFTVRKVRHLVVWLAERSADWIAQGRFLAIAYIAIIFYLMPAGVIWATGDWEAAEFYDPVVPAEVEEAQAARTEEPEGISGLEDLEEAGTEIDADQETNIDEG